MAIQIYIERISANIQDLLASHYKYEKWHAPDFGGLLDKNEAELAEAKKEIEENESRAMTLLSESNTDPVDIGNGELFYTCKRIVNWDEFKFRNCLFLLFRDCLYAARGPYTMREFKLAVCEFADKERKHFERLSTRHNGADTHEIRTNRERIPENVRRAVWRRDQGKCARCGGRDKIEYDHIIPISEGGGNTARNIELLCQQCNRSKGANIG